MVIPILRSRQLDEGSAAAIGYDICAEVASQNLEAGIAVVIDGVHATHRRRQAWCELSMRLNVPLAFLETRLEAREHERRVAQRQLRSAGFLGPGWEQIRQLPYDPWHAEQLSNKVMIDTADLENAVDVATRWIQRSPVS